MPNNWDERIKFFDSLISALSEVREDGSTLSEQINTNEDAVAMVEGYKKLKDAHLEAEKRRSKNKWDKLGQSPGSFISNLFIFPVQ
jgi:hypothetical protein